MGLRRVGIQMGCWWSSGSGRVIMSCSSGGWWSGERLQVLEGEEGLVVLGCVLEAFRVGRDDDDVASLERLAVEGLADEAPERLAGVPGAVDGHQRAGAVRARHD